MQHTSELLVKASIEDTLAVLKDLSTYPDWNDIVKSVEPDIAADAWFATLEARIGPFARSKRLRMVREASDATNVVAFVRNEPDRARFASWRMEATVTATPDAGDGQGAGNSCCVRLQLSYDGDLWTAPLGPILASAIDQAVDQLSDYVQGTTR